MVVTTSVNKHLTKCLLKWTALKVMKVSSLLRQLTVQTFLTLRYFALVASTVRL
ncbi:hypothetical protein MGSAQ_001156 [marine sediment metagenome]|uniref:Uncharacterized protein n=1 Tax=marine sediment metagenome TaxID=412755 RepID=A0A1B6NVG4_9ZZZZ